MNSLNEPTGKYSDTSRSQLLIPIGSIIINSNDRPARGADFAATPLPRSQSLQHGSFDPLPSMFSRDCGTRNGPKGFIPAICETRRDRGSLFKKPLRSKLSGLIAALSPYVTAGVLLALLASSVAFYLGATNPSAYAKTQAPPSISLDEEPIDLARSLVWSSFGPEKQLESGAPRAAKLVPVLRDRGTEEDASTVASAAYTPLDNWSTAVEVFGRFVAETRAAKMRASREKTYRQFEAWLSTKPAR